MDKPEATTVDNEKMLPTAVRLTHNLTTLDHRGRKTSQKTPAGKVVF
jgi:hypothetical protein